MPNRSLQFTTASLVFFVAVTCSGFAATPSVVRVDIVLGPAPRTPNVFYVDPVNGSMDGDGSRAKPWSTLANVVAAKLINGEDTSAGAVHAGDMIYLLNGNHGTVILSPGRGKFNNTSPITVQAMPNHKPIINQLAVTAASNWTFRGLTFSPAPRAAGEPIAQYFMLARFSSANNIIFDRNTLYSQPDVTDWTPQDWLDQSVYKALSYDGSSCTISNNIIRNVRIGMAIGGSGVHVTGNLVDYFASDAIEFTASNTVIRGNTITNHYGYVNDGLHNDCIQGWTTGGATGNNVYIDSNLLMASTGNYATIPIIPTGVGEDSVQGISIFDGVWNRVTVTNNVVVVPAYHGISMYGVSNLTIQNNTVVSHSSSSAVNGWIGIFNRKDGTAPTGVVVRNNIAPKYNFTAANVVSDHNIAFIGRRGGTELIVDPLKLFVTYAPDRGALDLHLLADSPAIGAGGLPMLKRDKDGRVRTTNDCGAYAR